MREPRVVLVHDWMVSPGGAEKTLFQLHQIWPEAPIYTAAYTPQKFPEFADAEVRTTWLDHIALAKTKHQLFPVLRAWAFKSLNLSAYDIVISSSSAEAKYVRVGSKSLHICYCHTPIRYYWSDYEWYLAHPPFGPFNGLARAVLPMMIRSLRRMDYRAAQRVDEFVANSRHVQERIATYYKRSSTVIYPPVSVKSFPLSEAKREYYVIVGRQVAYKRLDLAVDAFNILGLPLKVSGVGEEINVQAPRAGDNIEFLGRVPDDQLAILYGGAKALIFPAEEDFGIVPVEAMACGTPVVAYGEGGALETVKDGVTGVLFKEKSPQALVDAVKRLETLKLDHATIRRHAFRFSDEVFRTKMKDYVNSEWEKFSSKKTKRRR